MKSGNCGNGGKKCEAEKGLMGRQEWSDDLLTSSASLLSSHSLLNDDDIIIKKKTERKRRLIYSIKSIVD